MRRALRRLGIVVAIIAGSVISGCATMAPVDLSQVRFSLERVSDVRVAGIDISAMQSVEELNPFQLARASLAVSRQRLPLDMTLHLKSENPVANRVAARLVSMEWTLMLDGRETISGRMDRSVRIPAGEAQEIPIRLHLNMFDYFDEKSAMDLLDLALAFAGEGGGIPHGVALKVRPVIDTPLGAIRYGTPLLIEPAGK